MDPFFTGRDSVYRRITSIIGGDLNRSELTALVHALSLVPLGRSEKRVKSLLIQRLEEARDAILPFLQTQQGIASLERTYMAIADRNRKELPLAEANERPIPLPPEATVEFYLNKPSQHGMPNE
jgi:hypothetical protein